MSIPQQRKQQFIPREPKPRIGGYVDTTHMRFVDTATPKELREEYKKIEAKESKLPYSQRKIISAMFE